MSLGSPVHVGLAGLASAVLTIAVLTPAEAKVLRTDLRADPAMVDPITYSELVAGDVMKNLYEGFTEIDKDGNVAPALAVRWEANPDNKGFRFHLRKGVKFHSGREFTAKDVKWTFEQILLPGNKGGLTLTYLKVLEGAPEIQEGKAEQVLLSDWGTCPLVVRMQIALRKPNVQGVHLTPFRFLPFKTVKLD
jgi:peptide/nickel transport system substrate-binding protein